MLLLFGYQLSPMTSFLLVFLLLAQLPAGLQAQTGVVTGVVRTDSGIPLEGVRIAVTPVSESAVDSGVLESQGLTDSAGRYRLENISPGRYRILVGRNSFSTYHPGVAELDRATIIQVVARSTIEVLDMVYRGKNVRGRVVDLATGNGRRIDSLVLCCDYSQPVLMANANTVGIASTFAATISADGSFVFPALTSGNYLLSTADPNVIPVSWTLVVGENDVTGLRLGVSEGVEVQGTVLDQAGKPVTAFVRLRYKAANPVVNTIGPPTNVSAIRPILFPRGSSLASVRERLLKAAREHSQTLGPDGRLAFKRVYPGVYVVEISKDGVSLVEREIQVGGSGLTNVSLQVPAIQVSGRVIGPTGSPLPKLNYIRLARSGADSDIFYGRPDGEGNFSMVLVPGKYRVFTERLGPSVQSVSDGSRDVTNTEFTLEGGLNQQIVVTLQP
jgi:hypothetical protein